jgi:formamidopyrimidine-DNA glycosylase
MPELPEVETIRTDLEPVLVGRTLVEAECCADPPFAARYVGLDQAVGQRIRALGRRGKYLIAELDRHELVIHLGMTGQFGVTATDPRYLRVRFTLDDGTRLAFADQRRFGKIHVVAPGDYVDMPTLAAMGPEPLEQDFRFAPFAADLSKAKNLKALLLSQKPVAGLGNIYVDEALHQARLHPERGPLDMDEIHRLYQAIPAVLAAGVRNRGTTLKDYRDGRGGYGTHQDHLLVFDREGEPCRACGTAIVKLRVAQRGTYLCPSCQRL